jgi:tRNA(adenine34) deaminase
MLVHGLNRRPDRMHLARSDGTIPSVWETLSEPWRACVGLAWEAYCAGSLPIGAVVANAEGRVLFAGRNRIHEPIGPPGTVFGRKLAHAELNALLSLEDKEDPCANVLYTTTEPCPLCVGAARMAEVGGLRYASREPWAGSAAMFETVPYLQRGNLDLEGPQDPHLEAVLLTLLLDRFLHLEPKVLPSFLKLYREVLPKATREVQNIYRSGLLRTMNADGASARGMVLALSKEFPKTALSKSPADHEGVHDEHDQPRADRYAHAEKRDANGEQEDGRYREAPS